MKHSTEHCNPANPADSLRKDEKPSDQKTAQEIAEIMCSVV